MRRVRIEGWGVLASPLRNVVIDAPVGEVSVRSKGSRSKLPITICTEFPTANIDAWNPLGATQAHWSVLARKFNSGLQSVLRDIDRIDSGVDKAARQWTFFLSRQQDINAAKAFLRKAMKGVFD